MVGEELEAELARTKVKLVQYEQVLRAAAPRLAAFKRLEDIARAQNATPEAIAADASKVMLEHKCRSLQQEIADLTSRRDSVEKELGVLAKSKDERIGDLAELRGEQESLHLEIAEAIDELEVLRNDADRLMAERRELESMIADLREERDRLVEGRAPTPQRRSTDAGREVDYTMEEDGEAARRFDAFFSTDIEPDKSREWMLG